jgi:hypothetical protein
MGACECIKTTTVKTKDEVRKWVAAKTAEMGSERSGLYSGNWYSKETGVNFIDRTFTNPDKAWDHLVENNNKWRCVDAIKVEEKQGTELQNRRIEIQKEIERLALVKFHKFHREWVENLKKQSAKTKSCKNCKRRFPICDIVSTNCPKCRASLLTDTQTKRLSKLEDNHKKEAKKLQEMIDRRGGKTKTYWIIGGNCPT